MRLDSDDSDDARHLRALTFRLEAVLPPWVHTAHAFAKVLQAFDELVGRREAALTVLLSLARSPLVALIHGTPLACARYIHPLFNAKVITASRAHAAFPGRFFAVAFVRNPHAGACGLASVDVVAAIAATHRFEHAWAIATSRAWDAPVGVRNRRKAGRIRSLVSALDCGPRCRHARVANKAIVGGPAVHWFVAPSAVLDVVLAPSGVLDGIRVAVFATDEPLRRGSSVGAGFTAASNRHTDGAKDHTSQPKSIHHFSPRTGVLAVV
jgi:hypothetical protein